MFSRPLDVKPHLKVKQNNQLRREWVGMGEATKKRGGGGKRITLQMSPRWCSSHCALSRFAIPALFSGLGLLGAENKTKS